MQNISFTLEVFLQVVKKKTSVKREENNLERQDLILLELAGDETEQKVVVKTTYFLLHFYM